MKLMNSQRKRLLSFVLAFALIISIFNIMPFSASATVGDVFKVGSLIYTVTADNEVKISGFDQVSTEVTIDETVNYEGVDYKITAIDATTDVFRKCTSLEKITFKNPNLNIIARTFYGASALKEIYIYSDITFDDMAISRTPILENIYCYSSNVSYSGYPFPDMESSPNLKFYGYDGSSTEKFAKEQEYPFISLGAVPSTEPSTEPEETTLPPLPIGESFTVGSLTYTVTADNEVKISGFDQVSTEVTIDETVNYEGVDYKITAIDATTDVFRKCTSLEKITFKNPNLNIIARTFYGASALKEIYIYSEMKFEYLAISRTPDLENIYCYSPNIIFENNSFPSISSTPNVKIHGYDGSTAEAYAEFQQYPFVSLGAIPSTEPSTVATEPSTEPAPSTEVTEPTTGPEDTSIFTWQTIDDGTAVEITGFKPEHRFTYDVVIPSEINGLPVTSIGYNAFYGTSIFNLEFPSTIKVISERAFRECGYLKKVTFPEDSQLEIIGNDAFYRMQGQSDTLNEVVLPASLKQVGYRAFYNRENLLTVKVLSKDVVFGDSEKGTAVFDLYVAESKLKLYGYTGSTAETYAKENNHMFRYLDLNTDELQALYDKANAIDSSLYTKESYDALAEQIKAAKKMLANRDATPQMVNDCIKDLQAAIDGLLEYVEPTTTEPEPTVPTTVPIEYIEYVLGDVDGTEGISIDDATAIQMHAAELTELKGANLFAADINADESIDIQDVTLVQMWIAELEEAAAYKIGEKCVKEVTPTQPTDPQPTDPQPTESDYETFYVPNYVSWLTDLGGKMWVYNDATEEFTLMDYDMDFRYFFVDLPKDWTELSLYRTPFETTEEDFDINSPWDDEAKTGVILNKWEHLGDKGTNNSYKITGDGEGFYTMFDPDIPQPDERTIYFDNSTTQWGTVYIYGWSFGLYQEFVQMEPEGNDIWSYTFYDDLPVDGVKGFLFVNQDNWSGATQTNDLATQEGKNLFVPHPGGQKLSGTWDVYTP